MGIAFSCLQCGKPFDAELVENRFAGVCPSCLAGFALADSESVQPSPGAPDPASLPPLKPGGMFHGLEVIELLGAGGMGVVYKARHPGLDRFVALKVLSPRLADDPEFAGRFNREARALAALSHPNIVQVYDFGREGELYFLTMEYVDGLSLRRLMKGRRLQPDEALKIVPQICEALEYAHSEGVVHRDIKPENLLIDRKGRLKIADFGLAKLLSRETAAPKMTLSNVVMGTPGYMAPEQIMSMKVDHRVDIYSLGAVFYEMLTGEVPLGRFEPPSRKVQVDVRLDEVVLKALEKEPDRRYQRASELKTRVESVGASPAPDAAPLEPSVPAGRKTHALVFVSVVLTIASYAFLYAGLAGGRERMDDGLPLFFFLQFFAAVTAIIGIVQIEERRPRLAGRGLALTALFLLTPPFGQILGGVAWWICSRRDRRFAGVSPRPTPPAAPRASRAVPVAVVVFFVLVLGTCGGGIVLYVALGSPAAAVRSLGKGKTATEHGPNCPGIRAAQDLSSDLYRSDALEPIAERSDLTTHEQMHLVDVVIDDFASDLYRKDVLARLAKNPGLTREGRDYLLENLKGMTSDLYRSDVLEALPGRPRPESE